jgi:hypothetical protein
MGLDDMQMADSGDLYMRKTANVDGVEKFEESRARVSLLSVKE